MSKNYNKLWPAQARAKWVAQKKVQRGELVKPQQCQACGKHFTARNLQAHHYDYARPTDVIWLCSRCHKIIHAGLGNDWKAGGLDGQENETDVVAGTGSGMERRAASSGKRDVGKTRPLPRLRKKTAGTDDTSAS
jgi:hypothetical protein